MTEIETYQGGGRHTGVISALYTPMKHPGVYLIHLDRPLGGWARHYLGIAPSVGDRLIAHMRGDTDWSWLTQEIYRRGIPWSKVTVWWEVKGGTIELYGHLRRQKNYARYCWGCEPKPLRPMGLKGDQIKLGFKLEDEELYIP